MCPHCGCLVWRTASLPSASPGYRGLEHSLVPPAPPGRVEKPAARRGRGRDCAGSWRALSFSGCVAPSPSWGVTRWLWVPPGRAGTSLLGGRYAAVLVLRDHPYVPQIVGLGSTSWQAAVFIPALPSCVRPHCVPCPGPAGLWLPAVRSWHKTARPRARCTEILSFSPGSSKAEPCCLGQPALVQPQV